MQSRGLPQWIEPRKMAEKHAQLTGTMLLVNLGKLTDLLASNEGEVAVKIDFAMDEQNIPYLQGQIETNVWLICQRCLEPYQQRIKSAFLLSPVTNDKEAAMLPNPYEALLVENTVVELAAIIEEEILLNLPIVAKHEPENCGVAVSYGAASNEQMSATKKANPFEVLAKLKTTKH